MCKRGPLFLPSSLKRSGNREKYSLSFPLFFATLDHLSLWIERDGIFNANDVEND